MGLCCGSDSLTTLQSFANIFSTVNKILLSNIIHNFLESQHFIDGLPVDGHGEIAVRFLSIPTSCKIHLFFLCRPHSPSAVKMINGNETVPCNFRNDILSVRQVKYRVVGKCGRELPSLQRLKIRVVYLFTHSNCFLRPPRTSVVTAYLEAMVYRSSSA